MKTWTLPHYQAEYFKVLCTEFCTEVTPGPGLHQTTASGVRVFSSSLWTLRPVETEAQNESQLKFTAASKSNQRPFIRENRENTNPAASGRSRFLMFSLMNRDISAAADRTFIFDESRRCLCSVSLCVCVCVTQSLEQQSGVWRFDGQQHQPTLWAAPAGSGHSRVVRVGGDVECG